MTLDEYAQSIGAQWMPATDERDGFWRVYDPAGDTYRAVTPMEMQHASTGQPEGAYTFNKDGQIYSVSADRGGNTGGYDYWGNRLGFDPAQATATDQYGNTGLKLDLANQIGGITSPEDIISQMGPLAVLLPAILPALSEAGIIAPAAAEAAPVLSSATEAAAPALSDAGMTAAQFEAGGGAAMAPANLNSGILQTIQDLGINVFDPMVQQIAKQAASGAIQSGIKGGNPLEGAVSGGVLGGLSSGIGGFTSGLTGNLLGKEYSSPLVDQMIGSGALSGTVAGLTGRDPLQGALTGAMNAGIGGAVGSVTNGLTGVPLADKALGSAATGAISSGVQGSDPIMGALSGALNTGVKAGAGALWDAGKGVVNDATKTADVNDLNIPPGTGMLASLDTGTQSDVQPSYGSLPPPPDYAAEYLAEVQKQQEQAANDLSVPSLETALAEPDRPVTENAQQIPDAVLNQLDLNPQEQPNTVLASAAPQTQTDVTSGVLNALPAIAGAGIAAAQPAGANMGLFDSIFNTSGAFDTGGTPDTYGVNSASTFGGNPPTDIFGTGGSFVNLGNSAFNQDGSVNPNNANALGLSQMGTAAGLTGAALQAFINSGGTQGSTAAGGGGVGTGTAWPFGPSGGSGGFGAGGMGGTGAAQGGMGQGGSSTNTNTFNPYINFTMPAAQTQSNSMDPSTMALFGAALGALGGSQTEPTIKSALPDWLTSQMASQAQPQPYTTQATQWGTQSMIPGQQANYMAGNQQQQNTINGNYLDPMKNPAIQGQLQALQDQFMTQTLPQTMGAAFKANPTGPMTDNSTFLNPSVGGGGMLNVAAQNLGRGYGQAVSQGYQQERTNQLGQTNNALATNPVGNAFGIQTANAAPLINYANATTGTGKNIFTGNPIAGALTGAVGLGSLFGNTGAAGSGTSNLFGGIQNLFKSAIGS